MNESITVKQSLKGNILYAFGAFAMSLISLLLVFVNFRPLHGLFGLLFQISIIYILFKVILAFGFVFFGYCFLFFLKRARSGKDILIVDEKGITDHSSALAFGFIPWSDIDRIYIDSSMGNQFLELVLINEEHYLSKLRGLKRQAALANKKLKHQIVCISLNSTGVSPMDLLPSIQELFEQSRSN
jgi:hypothetical protein